MSELSQTPKQRGADGTVNRGLFKLKSTWVKPQNLEHSHRVPRWGEAAWKALEGGAMINNSSWTGPVEPHKPQRWALFSPIHNDEAEAQRSEGTHVAVLHGDTGGDEWPWQIWAVCLPIHLPDFQTAFGHCYQQAIQTMVKLENPLPWVIRKEEREEAHRLTQGYTAQKALRVSLKTGHSIDFYVFRRNARVRQG